MHCFNFLLKYLEKSLSHEICIKTFTIALKFDRHLGSSQISKQCDGLNYQSRGFETSRDLAIKRLIGYLNKAQIPKKHQCNEHNLNVEQMF